MKMPAVYFLLLTLLPMTVLASEPDDALDAFHRAASEADLQTYFALMTEDVVFLGTDGTERWQGAAFRDFVRPHFEAGRGWTYLPSQRIVQLGSTGTIAWFDEVLHNDQLGACRGSGVLVLEQGGWKIAQYNLSVPIPNELVLDVVAQIRGESVPVTETASDIGEDPEVAAPEEAGQEAACRKKRHKTNRAANC